MKLRTGERRSVSDADGSILRRRATARSWPVDSGCGRAATRDPRKCRISREDPFFNVTNHDRSEGTERHPVRAADPQGRFHTGEEPISPFASRHIRALPGEFVRDVRRQGRLPTTRWMLEIGAILLQTEPELILKSRRVVPGRLLEDGFTFKYPHWREAAHAPWSDRERQHFPRGVTSSCRSGTSSAKP